MKVLQLVHKPQRRGAEIFAGELNSDLRRKGVEARSLFLYANGDGHGLELGTYDILLGGQERSVFEHTVGVNPQLARRISREIRTFQPDIVQANGGRNVKYGAILRRIAPQAGWRLVYQNIGDPRYWLKGSLRRAFYRRIVMPSVDGVVAVSNTTLDGAQEMYELKCPRVVIPNGRRFQELGMRESKQSARAKLGISDTGPIVLFLGSMSPEKRPDRFLRIVEQVSREIPDLGAWLVGDGPQLDEMKRLARQLCVHQRVRFWGYQSDVAKFISAVDLLALTSDSEGIPGAVLETGYLQRPVIATDVGALRECVRAGETGLLVAPDDEAGFAMRVVALLQRPAHAEMLGLNAGKWMEDSFDMAACTDRYLGFYKKVVCT